MRKKWRHNLTSERTKPKFHLPKENNQNCAYLAYVFLSVCEKTSIPPGKDRWRNSHSMYWFIMAPYKSPTFWGWRSPSTFPTVYFALPKHPLPHSSKPHLPKGCKELHQIRLQAIFFGSVYKKYIYIHTCHRGIVRF